MQLNSLQQISILRKLAQYRDRVDKLKRLLGGQPIGTVRIADASITNAKIGSLSASKLTTGQLNVATNFDIGDEAGGDYIRKDGPNGKISIFSGGVEQVIIGMHGSTPVIKIAKAGFDADSDTDPDHFTLYVDEVTDHILIKEAARGTQAVNAVTTTNIAHGLGYVPFCIVFYQVSAGLYRKIQGSPTLAETLPLFSVDATNLKLRNPTGSSVTFKYFIFYDLAT